QVLHRKARDRAFAQNLPHAFLDRWNELRGNRTADHIVDELETLAALERLDSQIHLAELTGAAGLLLVTMMAWRRARDRLFVWNARHVRLAAYAVALAHALEHHAQVQVAHPVQ